MSGETLLGQGSRLEKGVGPESKKKKKEATFKKKTKTTWGDQGGEKKQKHRGWFFLKP